MDKYITMSQKEINQYDIIKKLINKDINGSEASELLNLTVRHIRRLKKKVKKKGIKGLIHGNRGKSSNRQIPELEKQRIIKLLHKHYYDFGPLLATEKLTEKHNIKRDKGTIRSIMIAEKLWKPKQKKKEKHREWRQRKANYGEMLQYDGSYEYWFEDRNKKYCLLASIDDSTSKVWAKFDEHEGVKPTFSFWREYIEENGKPYSIYVDKFSTYSMNHKIAKENPDTLTQFERAMKELNIAVIHAHSPQAKGRVENLFKTLQDRLIKELRLNDISTVDRANRFLVDDFLPKFNAKFNIEPRTKVNLHKKLVKSEINRLDSIFSSQYQRVVKNDFTVSHKKQYFQLLKEQPATICKKDKIIVEERLDNSICFRIRGKHLNYELLPERPKKISQNSKNNMWVIDGKPNCKPIYKPELDHPWRKFQYSNKFYQMSK